MDNIDAAKIAEKFCRDLIVKARVEQPMNIDGFIMSTLRGTSLAGDIILDILSERIGNSEAGLIMDKFYETKSEILNKITNMK